MLVIPFETQETGNRFLGLTVPNPDDYAVGQSYPAHAVDPDGAYPVLATIHAISGAELAGTFEPIAPAPGGGSQ